MEHYGLISLIPVLVVVILAFMTRRTFEPLLIGSVVGFILLEGAGFFPAWLDAVYVVMMDGVTVWIILVCGLFGSLIKLLEKSGGALGFSAMATRHTKSRGAALIITWVLGIIVFVDDYLNALSVGAAMRKVTDHYKVPREMLAYVINSTGAAVCVLIPFSTWSAFMAGQLEANNVMVGGSGTSAYIATIPYILYAWVAVLIVPLFALKILPRIGPMKQAEERAETTGKVFPASQLDENGEAAVLESQPEGAPRVINFALPMLLLAGVTIYTEDMLVGVILAIVTCAVMFIPQKLPVAKARKPTTIKEMAGSRAGLMRGSTVSITKGVSPSPSLACCRKKAATIMPSTSTISLKPSRAWSKKAFRLISFWGMNMTAQVTMARITPTSISSV